MAFAKAPDAEVKKLFSAVRYGKFDVASDLIDWERQALVLLPDAWTKGSKSQQQEFVGLFRALFTKLAFPKIQKNFEKLDSVVYTAPKVSGDKATVESTLSLLHALKKQEVVVTYELANRGGSWRIVDVTVRGDKSLLSNIRKDQIEPILAEGGWEKLLTLMKQRALDSKG